MTFTLRCDNCTASVSLVPSGNQLMDMGLVMMVAQQFVLHHVCRKEEAVVSR